LSPKESESFSPLGLIGRIVLPFVLVYGTWNPSGVSFYHWAIAPFFSGRPAIGPMKVLVTLLLLAGWVVVIHATRRSLGLGGAILIAGIFGALVWLLIAKEGVFKPDSATAYSHLGLVALSLLLAIGMSWAIVRRKLTGQVEVDTEQR
jgi:FtsH-binding integral membrane protein